MKIVYLGHFADYGGLGHTARSNVRLLERGGHEIICQNINNHNDLSKQGMEWVVNCKAGEKYKGDVDIFLVHKSPWNQAGIVERLDQLPLAQKAKQKLYYTVFETSKWPYQWRENLSYFDKILTPSTWQMEAGKALMGKDYRKKFFLVHHPIMATPYEKKPNKIFTIYSTFSSIINRKGLDVLLTAYFKEFDNTDNVKLQLKLSPDDAGRKNYIATYKSIADCFQWKRLPRIEINQGYLTDAQMIENILQSDLYVCSARGEGFCLDLAEAAVNQVPCLCPAESLINWASDYLSNNCYYGAEAKPVITDTFSQFNMVIDTTEMEWLEPSIYDLQRKMRMAFENPSKFIANKVAIKYLSAENVLNQFNKAFEANI